MIQTRLREIMLQRELEYREPYSIASIAAATGLNPDTISNFRRGKTQRFDASVLNSLCGVLECQPGDLLVYVPEEEASHERRPHRRGPAHAE